MKKTYEIEFPVVLDAKDYHDFHFMKNVLTVTFGESFTFEELGYTGVEYCAAFYPKNMKIDDKVFESLQSRMILET